MLRKNTGAPMPSSVWSTAVRPGQPGACASAGEERLREAATHGFKRAIVAKANAPKTGAYKGLEVIAVERLSEALAAAN